MAAKPAAVRANQSMLQLLPRKGPVRARGASAVQGWCTRSGGEWRVALSVSGWGIVRRLRFRLVRRGKRSGAHKPEAQAKATRLPARAPGWYGAHKPEAQAKATP